MCAVIDIGFERTVVTVGENDGSLELCAVITNNVQIDRDAEVDISTQPGTAEGMLNLCLLLIYDFDYVAPFISWG